jgi:hydroxyacylglutathione hydrolase
MKLADGIHEATLIGEKTYRIDEAGIANCYLLLGEKKALLIDSGDGVGNLLECVNQLTSLPIDVVLTHRHCDHGGGRNWFKQYHFHKKDNHAIYWLESTEFATKKLAGMSGKAVTLEKKPYHAKKVLIDDTTIFDLGGRIIRMMNVPGHTQGSIVLIDEKGKFLFTGDEVNYWLWLQLPGCTSVEKWYPNAEKILSLMKSTGFAAYCGHNDGLLTIPMVEELLQRGKELLAGGKGVKVSRGVYSYPDNDWKSHSVIWYHHVR